jgi:hypothetical protein
VRGEFISFLLGVGPSGRIGLIGIVDLVELREGFWDVC